MWIHEDITHIYELEHVMELTLTKKTFGAHSATFKDVKDVVEIWEWLDLGLLPTLVKHTDPVIIYYFLIRTPLVPIPHSPIKLPICSCFTGL
jgi:hypothetical protein